MKQETLNTQYKQAGKFCLWCKKEITGEEGKSAGYGRNGYVHTKCKTASVNSWFEEWQIKRDVEKRMRGK